MQNEDSGVVVLCVLQVFYSLAIGYACQLILASYNKFNNNCHRDAILIGVCNSATSIYAGFVVFGTVGFVATQRGLEIKDVITAGAGLTFIVYPEAVSVGRIRPYPIFCKINSFDPNLSTTLGIRMC